MATFQVSRGGNRVRVWRPCEKLSVEFFKVGSVGVGGGGGVWRWYFLMLRGRGGYGAMKQWKCCRERVMEEWRNVPAGQEPTAIRYSHHRLSQTPPCRTRSKVTALYISVTEH